MGGTRWWARAALVVALAWAAGLASGAPAGAQPGGVTLAGGASSSTYAPGDPVRLRFTVTAAGGQSCLLSSLAPGTLSITDLTVDGAAVRPALTTIGYSDSLGDQLGASLSAPGRAVPLELTGGPGDTEPVLNAISLSATGQNVLSRWPVGRTGRYTATVVYGYPAAADGAQRACPGVSNAVTVTFTVGTPAQPRSFPWWWVLGGALLLLVVVGLILVARRHRGVAAVVLLVLAAQAFAATVPSHQASAKVVVQPKVTPDAKPDPKFTAAVARCMTGFGKPGGDPARIIDQINNTGKLVVIAKGGMPRGATYTPDAEGANNGTGADSIISWDPNSTQPYSDGTAVNDCAELYHELFHAYQMSLGKLKPGLCLSGNGTIEQTELDATRAENAYRKSQHLPLRTGYGGVSLPPGDGCVLASGPPRPTNASDICAGPGCADSNGDPHLSTFDGRHYDLQAAGEFVAVRSGTDLQVQVRQVPYPGSRQVSVNRAVAMTIDGDRLGIYQEDTGLRVRLNGVDRVFTGSTKLPKGGTLTHGADYYEVRWPDGSRVWVQVTGGWGLKVTVLASAARRGGTSGLLGNFDGNPDNDLASPSGSVLAASPSFDRLYRSFAPGWQVTAATSLFDYASGQSPKTFADPTFPDKEVTRAGLDAATAEQICRSAGVTAAPFLDDCVLDVALTGQSDFLTSAAQDQATAAASANTGNGGKPATGTVHPNGTLHDGDVVSERLDPGATATFGLDPGKATVVRLIDVTGETSGLGIAVDGPDASAQPGFTTSENGYYRVQPGGHYQVTVSRKGGVAGPYGFRVVTAKERRFDVRQGDLIGGDGGVPATGRLAVPGQVDQYVFTASQAGQLYLDAGTGCEFSVAFVDDVPAPHAYSPSRPCWDISLGALESGKRYQVVVWSDDAATGTYSFRIRARP
jgi:VWD domain-containing protein/NleD-like pathogen effector protein (putative zinc metallopeptidase)